MFQYSIPDHFLKLDLLRHTSMPCYKCNFFNLYINYNLSFLKPSATEGGPYDYTRSGNPTRDVLERFFTSFSTYAII